jgi:hypothetical protein
MSAIMTSPQKLEGMISETEAARFLGISVNTLKNYRRQKKLPVYRIGRRLIYDPVLLRRTLQEHYQIGALC